jgi:hypothetical protein
MTFEHRQRDVFVMGAAEAHGSKATPRHSAAAAAARSARRQRHKGVCRRPRFPKIKDCPSNQLWILIKM